MDEKYLEQALMLAETQRETGMRNVQAQLEGPGQGDCATCSEPIPSNRRLAVPGAIRCVLCQTKFERLRGLGL